jgi:hypothetical protein
LGYIAVPKPTVTRSMTVRDIKDNSYRIFVQGEWTIVPDDAVLLGPNKFGKAIVWFRDPWGVKPSSRIQCFIPDRAFKAEPLSEARQVAANVTKLSGLVLRT